MRPDQLYADREIQVRRHGGERFDGTIVNWHYRRGLLYVDVARDAGGRVVVPLDEVYRKR